MPTIHFRPPGSTASEEEALWVDDYVKLLDSGRLPPIVAYCGFKTFANPIEFEVIRQLSFEEYIAKFRTFWPEAEASVRVTAISPTALKFDSPLTTPHRPAINHSKPLPVNASSGRPLVSCRQALPETTFTALSASLLRDPYHDIDPYQVPTEDDTTGSRTATAANHISFNYNKPLTQSRGANQGTLKHGASLLQSRKLHPTSVEQNILRKQLAVLSHAPANTNTSRFQSAKTTSQSVAFSHNHPLTHRSTMSAPSLQVNGLSPVSEDGNSPTSPPSAGTRASRPLAQNLLTKLRPLPFQYKWSFWHDKANPTPSNSPPSSTSKDNQPPAAITTTPDNYSSRLTCLHEEIADIRTFYSIYNNFPWAAIRSRDTVHIFRKGVLPLWEDPSNLRGGAWTFRVRREKAQSFFHELTVLVLGNELQAAVESERDHVLGISYSVRPYNCHISVWNKLGDNAKSVAKLEEVILARMGEGLKPAEGSYGYKRHEQHDGWQEATKAVRDKGEKVELKTLTEQNEEKDEEGPERETTELKGVGETVKNV